MAEAVKLKEEQSGGTGPSFSIPGPIQKIAEHPRRWRQFLRDVRAEMTKVVWPTRQDVVSTTIVVTITVAFFGLFFLLTDFVFGHLDTIVLNYFKH